jgi:2-iminobutanoate/2-iminopropanoate deaminase
MAQVVGVPVSRPWAEPYRYSAATRIGDLVFVSGQVGVDADGMLVGEGDFLTQAHQAFANLREVLEAAGSGLDRVAKVTIFLTDVEQFAHVPSLRAQYFRAPYPADSTVVVRSLARPGLLVEVEAIAAA